MRSFFSNLIILTGIAFLSFAVYLFYLRNSSQILTFENSPKTVNAISIDSLGLITIPSIKLSLPIIPSVISNNKWQTTEKGVSYLASTPFPGQKGNSVMYGHNWKNILGRLVDVKPGEKIVITMQNGEKKDFTIEYTAVVNPNQTYIIDSTDDTRLTLYTCVGFLDLQRFVVVAKPTS